MIGLLLVIIGILSFWWEWDLCKKRQKIANPTTKTYLVWVVVTLLLIGVGVTTVPAGLYLIADMLGIILS